MFPSSGLLTQLNCFLFEVKLCERPHCVFKHGTEELDRREPSDKSTLNLTKTEEVTDECLQELERINREIESVKHQVEEEQRRLSNYQTKSSATTNYCCKSEVIGKNVVRDSRFSQTPCSETRTQPKKYTVDSSKPRTDLEYDPLSNFSSDLRSYCSSKRQHKSRNGHGSEREQSIIINQRMPHKNTQTQKLSLEHPDLNEDDDVLIIDLPSSPKTEETKPVRDYLPNDIVSKLAVKNANGHNEIVKENMDSVKLTSSQCHSTGNFISNDENIFVKMTQHLSNYNNLNTAQPCDIHNKVLFDKNSSANVLPVSKTQTKPVQKPIQKPEAPSMTAADAPRKRQPQPLVFVGSLCEPQDMLAAAKWTQNTFLQSAVVNQQMQSKKEDVIVLDSSSDELNYSDIEMSESDPDEECYRIFMEANGEEKSVPEVVSNAEKNDINLQPQALSGKKRVAHETKVPEVVSKARPQPQVLVPLRTPVSSNFQSQPPAPYMIRKVEQRASMLTSSIKARQALIGGQSEAKPPQTTPCSIPTKPAPCISYIPLGATVIDVGNNLHLVLPEGTFSVSDSSGQVSSVLSPITPSNTNPITMKQACLQSTATRQMHTTQPVIIPPQARKPVSAAAATNANPISTPQASVVKPVGNKRKLKQKCETVKVSHDIRQSYVNKFTEEFLKTTANINEAFGKALAEERTVYNRSANKLKYLSVAVNALKRLKNQSCGALKDKHQTSQNTKGNIPLNPSLLNGEGVLLLYECLKDYVLTDEMLIEGNFPFQNPEKPGCAIIFADKKSISDPLRKLCCRCGATYSVSRTGKHTRKEECTYHYGRGVENKVPGGVETRYSCCEGVMGSPGCQVFKLHVCNSLSMDGFVTTAPRDPTDTNCPGLYSLDCETCYTINGLELSRVTVVNSSLQIVYDTFVRPNNEVIDYNTRFSGISEEDLKGHCHSLKEVQENVLSFLSADTILIGHGLETNLCVLKLIHGMVVDTSVVFPHRLGPPHKLSLHSLTAEYLRKIIQESVCGHDTAEDAVACMELMLWKAKEDGKLKKAH